MTTPLATKIDQDRLLRIIERELEDLPPLPTVVVQVINTVNDPTASAADLKRLISADQALSAKILRLVNSSFYGFPRKITTITHAIVILGFSTVRNLATSLGVANGLGRGSVAALNREEFWAHSVAAAYAGQLIAVRRSVPARVQEEVFIGALMHDIGKLFLDRYFAEQYLITLKLARVGHMSIWDAERAALGISHSIIGKRVAEKWNLPLSMVAMVSQHHQPAYATEYAELVSIVHAADYLARKAKLGNAGDDVEAVLAPEVAQFLNFSPEVWETLEEDTVKKFAGATDFLKAMNGG